MLGRYQMDRMQLEERMKKKTCIFSPHPICAFLESPFNCEISPLLFIDFTETALFSWLKGIHFRFIWLENKQTNLSRIYETIFCDLVCIPFSLVEMMHSHTRFSTMNPQSVLFLQENYLFILLNGKIDCNHRLCTLRRFESINQSFVRKFMSFLSLYRFLVLFLATAWQNCI